MALVQRGAKVDRRDAAKRKARRVIPAAMTTVESTSTASTYAFNS